VQWTGIIAEAAAIVVSFAMVAWTAGDFWAGRVRRPAGRRYSRFRCI